MSGIKIVIEDAGRLADNLTKLEKSLGPITGQFERLTSATPGLGARLGQIGRGLGTIQENSRNFAAVAKRIADSGKPISEGLERIAKAVTDRRMDALTKLARNIKKLANSYEALNKAKSNFSKTGLSFNRLVGGSGQVAQQLTAMKRLEAQMEKQARRQEAYIKRQEEAQEKKAKRQAGGGFFGPGRALTAVAGALHGPMRVMHKITAFAGFLFRAGYIADLYIRRIAQAINALIIRPLRKVIELITTIGDKFRVFEAISRAKLGSIALNSLAKDLFNVANSLGSAYESVIENFQVLIKNPTIQDALRDSMGRIRKDVLKEMMMMLRAIEVAEPDLAMRFPIMFPNIMGGDRRSFANALEMSVQDAPVIMRKVMQQAIDDAPTEELKKQFRELFNDLPTLEDWAAGGERRLKFVFESVMTSVPRSVFDIISKTFEAQINKIKNSLFMFFLELGNSGAYAKILDSITEVANFINDMVSSDYLKGLYAEVTKFFTWLDTEAEKFIKGVFSGFDPKKSFINNIIEGIQNAIKYAGEFLENFTKELKAQAGEGGLIGLLSKFLGFASFMMRNIGIITDILNVILGVVQELLALISPIALYLSGVISNVVDTAKAVDDLPFSIWRVIESRWAAVNLMRRSKFYGIPAEEKAKLRSAGLARQEEARDEWKKAKGYVKTILAFLPKNAAIADRSLKLHLDNTEKRTISDNYHFTDSWRNLMKAAAGDYSAYEKGGTEGFTNLVTRVTDSLANKQDTPISGDELATKFLQNFGQNIAKMEHLNNNIVPTMGGAIGGFYSRPVVSEFTNKEGELIIKITAENVQVNRFGNRQVTSTDVIAELSQSDLANLSDAITSDPSKYTGLSATKDPGTLRVVSALIQRNNQLQQQQRQLEDITTQQIRPAAEISPQTSR
jgi:hypothetical protein